MNGISDDPPHAHGNKVARLLIDVLEKRALEVQGSNRKCLRRACEILLKTPQTKWKDVATQTPPTKSNAPQVNATVPQPKDTRQENVVIKQEPVVQNAVVKQEPEDVKPQIHARAPIKSEPKDDNVKQVFHGRTLIKGDFDKVKPRDIPFDATADAQLTDPRLTGYATRMVREMVKVERGNFASDSDIEVLGEVRYVRAYVACPSTTVEIQATQQLNLQTIKKEKMDISPRESPGRKIESIGSPEQTENRNVVDMEICSSPDTTTMSPQIVTNVPVPCLPPATSAVRFPIPRYQTTNPFVKPK